MRQKAELEGKIRENRSEVRKGALLAEKLRAAQLRAKRVDNEKVGLVEVDEKARKKVTLVSRKRLIENPSAVAEASVRRVPLSEVGNTGLEAAIREQERQRARDEAVMRQMEAAKKRGDAAIQREWRERMLKEKISMDDCSSLSESNPVLSTIHEMSEPTTTTAAATTQTGRSTTAAQVHWRNRDHDIDLVPVRGPSSSATSPESSKDEPSVRPGGVSMGGPTSAFAAPRPSQRDLDAIRDLLERVEKQKRDLTLVAEGSGAGAKNDETDRNFVAKVLGVPPSLLEGQRVNVKVNIEEVSTFEEETTIRAKAAGATGGGDLTSSSSDITRERFLVQPMRPLDSSGRRQQQQQQDLDVTDVWSLIEELKGSDGNRSAILKNYIEQLLEMRREEISQLSVTSSSSSKTENTTGSASSSSKSFVTSTPASILSSSDSRSSVGSKTVRFVDEADGTFTETKVKEVMMRLSLTETREKEAEITRQTKASIEEVRAAFEEKRREIETALAKRFEKKLSRQLKAQRKEESSSSSSSSALLTVSSASLTALSEGPLSDSKSTSSSSVLTDSTKESSLTSTMDEPPDPPEMASMLQNLRHSWAQSMLRRARNYAAEGEKSKANKSSSSGTTTTSSGGSQAVAELRERLAKMEIPSLVRPTQQLPATALAAAGVTTSTSDDTFARVAELLSEEAAMAATAEGSEFSSFHFSPDDEAIGDEPSISFLSLSTDSDRK
jgi:hypothetical protein